MKILLNIFIFCFIVTACGDSIEDIEVFYANGKLKSKGRMNEGLEHGSWIRYYKDGVQESSGEFYLGTQIGDWTWWHKNGKLKEESHFDFGEVNGISIRYFENGKIRVEEKWRDDLRIGLSKAYHKNGNLNYIGKYSQGIKDSVWVLFYENGQVEDSVKYIWGREEGIGIKYFKNGSRKEFGQWRKGYKYGVWRYFHGNGKEYLKGEFSEFGWRDGEWHKYDSLGITDSVIVFKHGFIDTSYEVLNDTFDIDSVDIEKLDFKNYNTDLQEDGSFSKN